MEYAPSADRKISLHFMKKLHNWLLHDHRRYEMLLEECRREVEKKVWSKARDHLDDLVSFLKGHFVMEEQVLFPAYEELTSGLSATSTKLLCHEHDAIRSILKSMHKSLAAGDFLEARQHFHCLVRTMELHHQREEQVFLPLAGHILLIKREEIINRLKRHDWKYAMKAQWCSQDPTRVI
jgi:DUF438 domain-containing protein